MTEGEGAVVQTIYRLLNTARRNFGAWTPAVAATHWLEQNGAGFPEVALMQEHVRSDAAIWAGCSHEAELEAYLSASLEALGRTPITNSAAKRLAVLAYKSMDPEDQVRFIVWAEKQ